MAGHLVVTGEGDIQVTPRSFQLHVAYGDSTTESLTVKNTGDGALTFQIYESGALRGKGPDGVTRWDIPWLSEDPTSGTIAPGDSVQVEVLVDTMSCPGDSASAYLVILSNDPDENPMVVEVSLTIDGDLTGVSFDQSLPTHFDLVQNAPNPFNPSTSIAFDVPGEGSSITLQIFDIRGRLVATLARGYQPAGRKTITWDGRAQDGRKMPSGVYYYLLQAPGYQKTLKMTLVQ